MKASTHMPIRTYSAQAPRTTLVRSLAQAVAELVATREILWRLFVRDFTVQFRHKMLGYLWTVINPVIVVGSFLFLNHIGVLSPGELAVPYPLYVFVGISLWSLLPGIIAAVSGGLLANGDLVLRTSVPKIALALSGTANVIYLQMVNLVILLVLFAWWGVSPSAWGVVLPLLVLPLAGLALGVGLLLAVLGALARDVTVAVTAVLNFLMYVTPVLYVPRVDHSVLGALIHYNPLAHLINGPRSVLFHGALDHPQAFALSSIFAFMVLAVGIHAFYLIQDKVAERL